MANCWSVAISASTSARVAGAISRKAISHTMRCPSSPHANAWADGAAINRPTNIRRHIRPAPLSVGPHTMWHVRGDLVRIRTRRTNSTRSRAAAIAVIGATPTAMLDAIISRAEAARTPLSGSSLPAETSDLSPASVPPAPECHRAAVGATAREAWNEATQRPSRPAETSPPDGAAITPLGRACRLDRCDPGLGRQRQFSRSPEPRCRQRQTGAGTAAR